MEECITELVCCVKIPVFEKQPEWNGLQWRGMDQYLRGQVHKLELNLPEREVSEASPGISKL